MANLDMEGVDYVGFDGDENTDDTVHQQASYSDPIQTNTRQINEGSTSGLSLRTRLNRTKVDDLYEKYEKELGSSVHIVKRYDLFKMEEGKLRYVDYNGVVKNLEKQKDNFFRAEITLLERLGRGRLKNLGFPSDDVDKWFEWRKKLKQNSSEEHELEELANKMPDNSELEKLDGNELVEKADKMVEVVETVIKDGQTLEFGKYLREIVGLDKSLRDIRGALKTATAKHDMTKVHLHQEYA